MKQLCQKLDEIPPWLLKYKQDSHSPSAACTVDSFCEVGQTFDTVIIVVDALDECPREERDKIIGFITTCVSNLHAKALVASRREGDILEAFQSSNIPKIEIQADNVMGDIQIFVCDEVKRLREGYHGKRLYIKDDALEETVIRSLTDKSEGM